MNIKEKIAQMGMSKIFTILFICLIIVSIVSAGIINSLNEKTKIDKIKDKDFINELIRFSKEQWKKLNK